MFQMSDFSESYLSGWLRRPDVFQLPAGWLFLPVGSKADKALVLQYLLSLRAPKGPDSFDNFDTDSVVDHA